MKAGKAGSALIGILLLYGLTGAADAGVITSASAIALPGFSTGSIGPLGATPAPNNDNATAASPNLISYSIFYNAGGFGITDVEFVLNDSGGTTEYRFAQTLINNSGRTWGGFRFELGYGIGSTFVRSAAGDGLDFDTPDRDPAPSSSRFALIDHEPDVLGFTGGLSVPISASTFGFSVDVPDGLQRFNPAGVNRFTLRQFQLPEPATALLLLTVLTAGGFVSRPKRR